MKKYFVFAATTALLTACGQSPQPGPYAEDPNSGYTEPQIFLDPEDATNSQDAVDSQKTVNPQNTVRSKSFSKKNPTSNTFNLKEYIAYNLAQSEIEKMQENINEQLSGLKPLLSEDINSILSGLEVSKNKCQYILNKLKEVGVQMNNSNSLSPEIFALKTDIRMVLFYMDQFTTAQEKNTEEFQKIYAQLQGVEKSFGRSSYHFVQEISKMEEEISGKNPDLADLLLKYPILSSEQMAMRASFLEAQNAFPLHVYNPNDGNNELKNFANIEITEQSLAQHFELSGEFVMTPGSQYPASVSYVLPSASTGYCVAHEDEDYCDENINGMMSILKGAKTTYTLYQKDTQKICPRKNFLGLCGYPHRRYECSRW
jgi:hypothetical protein